MKKTLFLLLLIAQATISCADDDTPIQVTQLPQTAQQFIQQYFAEKEVALAKQENDFLSKSYKVIFTDGTNMEFDRKGNWTEIECKTSIVPIEIIPEGIVSYVESKYPGMDIIEIEKDNKTYEIKMSNYIELEFDSNFNLIDLDL